MERLANVSQTSVSNLLPFPLLIRISRKVSVVFFFPSEFYFFEDVGSCISSS